MTRPHRPTPRIRPAGSPSRPRPLAASNATAAAAALALALAPTPPAHAAGQAAAAADTTPAPAPGQQVEQGLDVGDGRTVPYQLYLPHDYQAEGEKKWPLMLFLHGRGESYGPLSLVKKWGPPRMADRGDKLPFIVASPQCPGNDRWTSDTQQAGLLKLLDHLEKNYRVDTDRVWLTGLSMGGYGSWRLAADHPGRFAAVAPVCGGGKTDDAKRLAPLPIWVFHGTEDKAVPFQKSVDMVEAIRDAGGEHTRFTSLEHTGHNCWSATYASPELYSWMAQQSAQKNRERGAGKE